MAKKRLDERSGENVDDEEPNFDDPEDFVDDVSEQGKFGCMRVFYEQISQTSIFM